VHLAASRQNSTRNEKPFKISAFILIIVGTGGRLLNEIAREHSSTRIVVSAVVNFAGLVNLGFTGYGLKSTAGD
jgi:hypothetical protein